MYITEPLHRLIIAAQLAASVNGLYAILPLLISLGFVADARGTVSPLWSLFALGGFYLVTSVALFVLAVYMGRAKIWAYVATWIVAALLAVQIVIDIGIFFHLAAGEKFLIRQFTCCGLTHLPHLLLAVAALNSVEEIHSAVRQRRRE